jgi:predicted DNA-binding protein with PD1-like motif
MKYSTAQTGRTFIIRLEHGDILHESIEAFCEQHAIRAASLIVLGGADKGSRLIVGPEDGEGKTIVPMEEVFDEVREITGTGTVFSNEEGKLLLHMHIASGRNSDTITGCVRKGVKTWHVMEVILTELVQATAQRKLDRATGFELLVP